jgi:hypothetical protein
VDSGNSVVGGGGLGPRENFGPSCVGAGLTPWEFGLDRHGIGISGVFQINKYKLGLQRKGPQVSMELQQTAWHAHSLWSIYIIEFHFCGGNRSRF